MGCSRRGTPHPFLLGAKQQLASLQQGAGTSWAPTRSSQSPVPRSLLVTAGSRVSPLRGAVCHLSGVPSVTSLMPFEGAAAYVTHGVFRGGQNDP